jgi:hypothetical protein
VIYTFSNSHVKEPNCSYVRELSKVYDFLQNINSVALVHVRSKLERKKHHFLARQVIQKIVGCQLRELMKKPLRQFEFFEEIYFCSISYSGNSIIIAITKSGHLGVDIERGNDQITKYSILSLLDSSLRKELLLVEDWKKTDHLVRLWTSKEAVMKCLGQDLRIFDRIRLPLIFPGKAILESEDDSGKLMLYSIDTEVGFLSTRFPVKELYLVDYSECNTKSS